MFIKIKDIKESYPNLPIKGIIHIGAHEAEEYEDYKGISVEKMIWVEANPDLMGYLKNKFSGDDKWGDNYPTPQPLLQINEDNKYPQFFEEKKDYTWICYLELN